MGLAGIIPFHNLYLEFSSSVVTEWGGALNSSVCSEDVDICNSLLKSKNKNTRNHDCYVMSFLRLHFIH